MRSRTSQAAVAPLIPKIRGASFPTSAFEEDVVTSKFLGRRLMILNRPEAVHHVLVSNPENYIRPFTAFRVLAPPIEGGLFLAEGAEWRRQRRLLAPAFSPRSLPDFAEKVVRNAQRTVARLPDQNEEVVDLFTILKDLSLAIAADAFFSLDTQPFNDKLRRLAQHYSVLLAQPTLLDFLLPASIPSPRDLLRRRFRRRWRSLIAEIVAERRRLAAPEPDLFDTLLTHEKDEDRLQNQVATLLITGSETTGAALFWSANLVATRSDVQERVAEEAHGLDFLSGPADLIPRLPYTRAVVQESLRLYPPALSIVRQAIADDLAGSIAIPAGAIVQLAPWVLHRHNRLWRDPNTFDPTRFLPESPPPLRYAYIPFGVGPRACIGAQSAVVELVLALAMLLRCFCIAPTTSRPVGPVAQITLQPHDPPPFRVRPRRGTDLSSEPP